MAIEELEVVELVVLACLMAEPQHCEEFHMPFLRPMAVFECMTKPPTLEVVQWANEHPLWAIKRWTCGSRRTIASALERERLLRETTPDPAHPVLPAGCPYLARRVDLRRPDAP